MLEFILEDHGYFNFMDILIYFMNKDGYNFCPKQDMDDYII